MENETRSCANCGSYACEGRGGSYPEFCLTQNTDSTLFQETLDIYNNDEEVARMFLAAAEVEGEYYGSLTRVEEICVFARKIGAKRIGIAACRGLASEGRLFAKVLRTKGFEPVEVICKVGCNDKTCASIPEQTKIHPNEHESLCNPIAQARILAERGTDLNVICGLCVGHDTLFIRYSEAPVTYLAVKDRVTCHNPVAPLHTMDTYYKRLLDPDLPEPKNA